MSCSETFRSGLIILFCFGIYFWKNQSERNLYASFYDPKDLPSMISRGSEEEVINQVVVAFQNKNYRKSLDLIESSEPIKSSKEISFLLHYGMIHLELGNFNEAIDKFNEVVESDSIDKTKGLWFRALAYIKSKDYKNARLILQEISSNPDYFNHAKAKLLIQETPE